jgi:Cu/Ag efflux pump CusA
VTHYNIQPVVDIYGAVDGKDLGSVSSEIAKIVDDAKKELPKGSRFEIRGQVQTMHDSFTGLIIGLACAMVLVYLRRLAVGQNKARNVAWSQATESQIPFRARVRLVWLYRILGNH